MQCPKCKSNMVGTDAGGVAISKCSSCAGVWVPTKAMDLLLRLEGIATDSRRMLADMPKTSGAKLPCPDCFSASLVQVTVAGIELDVCVACHGIYFDRDELAVVVPNKNEPEHSKLASWDNYVVGEGLFQILAHLLRL